MSNWNSSNQDKKQHIDCSDIYMDVTRKHLKSRRRFMETWSRSESKRFDYELFQYADLNFDFYRFAVSSCKRDTKSFLTEILFRIMGKYGLNFLIPDNGKNAPFEFILIKDNATIGFRFVDFTRDEDVNAIISDYEVNSVIIIHTWKAGIADERVDRDNK